jgi:hypothetical protein
MTQATTCFVQEYHRLIELLDGFDEHVKQLTQLRALLGEELQPQ